MLTAEFLDTAEALRWTPDPEITEILNAEVRLLCTSGDLENIYRVSAWNTERTWLIEEISKPRVKHALSNRKLRIAHWEYVIAAHDTAVSFSLRAASSLHEFKDAPYADRLVSMRLRYDLDDDRIAAKSPDLLRDAKG